jgi:hypothetical protein
MKTISLLGSDWERGRVNFPLSRPRFIATNSDEFQTYSKGVQAQLYKECEGTVWDCMGASNELIARKKPDVLRVITRGFL